MSTNDYKEYDIMILKVGFDDGTGFKFRPAIIIKVNGEEIAFYKITSQFENKSKYIQSKYFEIIDYIQAGLRKRSWIDTMTVRKTNEKEIHFHVVGRLSMRDTARFIQFLQSATK